MYRHKHKHAFSHKQAQIHTQTGTHHTTLNPSCLLSQAVRCEKERGCVASAKMPETLELFFSNAFSILGQIGFLLEEIRQLTNFGKVCERFPMFQVVSLKNGWLQSAKSAMLKMQLWDEIHHLPAAYGEMPFRLAVVPTAIKCIPCYIYVNQHLSLMLSTPNLGYSR